MARILRAGIWLVVVMACVAGGRLARRAWPAESDVARWFIPGSVGEEVRLRADGGRRTPDGGQGGQTAEGSLGVDKADDGRRRTDGGQESEVRRKPASAGLTSAIRHLPSGSEELPSAIGPLPSSSAGPSSAIRRLSSGFQTRAFSGLNTSEEQDWGRRNGLTKPLAFSHNLGAIFPPSLFAEHPEFFPLADGKRLEPPKGSYFWNPDIARPDVAKYAAEAAGKYFEKNPDEVSFPLGVNDALIWGESPELLALATPTKWFRDRPDYSNVVFTFMNRVAEQLEHTHPQKYLGALAYYWAENTPAFPLHPQVVPFLTADRGQGYDAAFKEEEFSLQRRWGGRGRYSLSVNRYSSGSAGLTNNKQPITNNRAEGAAALRRLGMYDYLYGVGFLIPRIHTKLLAENLRHARSVGFTDYFAEVNPNWGLDGPMPWLTAQLLQDPEQSEAALLDEYYRRYFKEAAAPMRRFFERCEEQWMNQPGPPYWLKHYRNESQAIIFPAAVCRELRALLEEARQRAGSGKVRQRVELTSVAFGVTERFVAFKAAKDQVTRTALQAALAPEIEASLVTYLSARREFIHYTSEVRRTAPLALHPFGWDDYLHNDPMPLALLALGRASTASTRVIGSSLPVIRDSKLLSEPLVAALWPAISSSLSISGPPNNQERITNNLPRTSSPPNNQERIPNNRVKGTTPNNQERVTNNRAAAGSRELLKDASMSGALRPGRTIAGLPYGVSLPRDWISQVEPAEFHRAELVGAGEDRVLRISGSKDTRLSQWTQIGGGGLHQGEIRLRGRVSTGVVVRLIFAWLDEKHQHVGWTGVRLPEGEWPEWVSLKQAGLPPKGAAWVGLGFRVQNQVPGDWVEAKGFSLRSAD